MDATIRIDGKPVVLRKTAGTLRRYNTETGREWNGDAVKLFDLAFALQAAKTDRARLGLIMGTATGYIYDMVYVMAKHAEPALPPLEDWMDEFDNFRVWEVIPQLLPLLKDEMMISPKNG